MNQTVLTTKNLRMTELLIISPYSCMFYNLYAIRNTKHAIRHTLYENRVSRIEQRFMQNKANLLNTQMNVSPGLIEDYENERLCGRGEKQTQSNPNQLEARRVGSLPHQFFCELQTTKQLFQFFCVADGISGFIVIEINVNAADIFGVVF